MFHYETVRILHHHGGDDWVPMDAAAEHDSAAHDPERAWLRGARIFRCRSCDEQIAIADPAETDYVSEQGFSPLAADAAPDAPAAPTASSTIPEAASKDAGA